MPEPFYVDSGGVYTLTPGQSASAVVRFAPTTAGGYMAAVGFSGGGGANAYVSGVATPGQSDKQQRFLGCGGEKNTGTGSTAADLLLMGVVALALGYFTRKAKRVV